MGIKPVPAKLFRKFLADQGLKYVRTVGGHEIWDRTDGSLLRRVTIQTHCKDVPMLHIYTTLKTLGVSKKEFERIIARLK